jgi:hypothetical protein
MLGAGLVTVKLGPLLARPPTVTTTLPVTAPVGIRTTILVPLQFVGAAFIPPNVTVLVPCVVPKFAPEIVTDAPTAPEPGLRLEMFGDVTVDSAVTAHDMRPIARAAFSKGHSHSPRSLLVEFHLPRGCVLILGLVKWWLIDLICYQPGFSILGLGEAALAVLARHFRNGLRRASLLQKMIPHRRPGRRSLFSPSRQRGQPCRACLQREGEGKTAKE